MRVLLVAMPWQMVESPPLPLGILRACAQRCRDVPTVDDYYANLHWSDYLLAHTDGRVTPADYDDVASVGVWHAVGEWVFAGTLYDDPDWRTDEYLRYLERRQLPAGASLEMRHLTFPFMAEAVAEVVRRRPDVVAFSTTFSQNAASLALARRVKAEMPHVVTVFGGGNCEAPMGAALHRNFPYVDFVVSGEGELAFPMLLDELGGDQRFERVPGLSWRDDAGRQHVNQPGPMVPMRLVPRPDYSAWHAAFDGSRTGRMVKPQLVMEAARGCWWGEKHHCTFCGLNGSAMTFRAKPADVFLDDLLALVDEHGINDVVMVDNILDYAYFSDLLPRLAELGAPIRLRYEVKANLRRDQLALLAAAGVRHIQPGIESLSSRVLGLMDKGVHSTQNVQVLRDSADLGIAVDWNLLYGFPGETESDYAPVAEQLPALVHLQPPSGAVRLLLERFSPYFERPELGFTDRRPSAQYRHVYDLPESELTDLAYQFDTAPRGIDGAMERAVRDAVRNWRRDHAGSSLVAHRVGERLVVEDRRVGWSRRDHMVDDPVDIALLDALATPRSAAGLVAAIGSDVVTLPELDERLARLRGLGLVYTEGGRCVSLVGRTGAEPAGAEASERRAERAELPLVAPIAGPRHARPRVAQAVGDGAR